MKMLFWWCVKIIVIMSILFITDLIRINIPFTINIQCIATIVLIHYIHKKFRQNDNNNIMYEKKQNKNIPPQQSTISVPVHHNVEMGSKFLNACRNGNIRIIQEMIKKGVNVNELNSFGEGAIYLATYYYVLHPLQIDVCCLWYLYHAGCSINVKTAEGFTPLHLAALYGHNALIKWLLIKGADPNVQPFPALIAWQQGHKQAAVMLSPRHLV